MSAKYLVKLNLADDELFALKNGMLHYLEWVKECMKSDPEYWTRYLDPAERALEALWDKQK